MNQSLKERYKIAELIAKSLSGSATDKEKKTVAGVATGFL